MLGHMAPHLFNSKSFLHMPFLTPFNPLAPSSVPWETLTRQWTTRSVSRGSRFWSSSSQSQGPCQDPVNVRDTADERGRETGNGEVRGEGWESER